jgi:hypothetical protein
MKENKSKMAFISFHFLLRIGTFQRVMTEENEKFRLPSHLSSRLHPSASKRSFSFLRHVEGAKPPPRRLILKNGNQRRRTCQEIVDLLGLKAIPVGVVIRGQLQASYPRTVPGIDRGGVDGRDKPGQARP